jgi:hypothetical protein
MNTIEEYKKISDQNLALHEAFHAARVRKQKPKERKERKFNVLLGAKEEHSKIKKLETYERIVSDKIKNLSDKDLIMNMSEIKLDRFKLTVEKHLLPQYTASTDGGFSLSSFAYEPVIKLSELPQKYADLISSVRKTNLSKDERREYNRIQKSRKRAEKSRKETFETMQNAWKIERQKQHIPESIIKAYENQIEKNTNHTLNITEREKKGYIPIQDIP